MKSSFKAFITGVWVFAFFLSSFFSSANNVRINGTVQVTQGTGDTLVLSFPLRWDNSWRDQFNWDAAWVFFKYKSGTGGWNHVNLCAGGHRFTDGSGLPVPFDCMPGNTGSSTVGLFVYRSTLEAGNTPEINCQMKCLKSSLGGLTAEKFTSHEGFVLAQAVEMVYVPYGGYYLGDGGCSNRFAGGSDGSPALIDSEDAITASTATKVYPFTNNTVGTAQSIAAVYPKGYKGFYMMKYEVSQEQWVYFLNTLTYAQQQERVPSLTTMKGGDYIFGSKSEPNNRNGIIVVEPSYNSNPVIFANNLNNNAVYSEDGDGKTIACNYLSPGDMVAYCSWAGLRPMSELEYEKACRSSYPEQPVKGEYAWHDNSISGRLGAVSNGGMRNERSGTANASVNAGNAFGPVRCGLFATGSSTQQSAGAAFWGGMDMSGNVKELCYNTAYTGFNGTTMGTGTYSPTLWSVTPAHFGVKGGGFSSPDSLLRVSDRTEANNYFTAMEQRDSTMGFRGVRSIGNEVIINQGKLIAKQNSVDITGTACPDVQLDLKADVEAKVMSGSNEVSNMAISYVWYVLKPGTTVDSIVPGATGAMLSYHDLKVTGTSASVTYKFRRKAICPVGESMTDYIVFTVPNMNLILNPTEANINACGNSPTITATTFCSSPVFAWNSGDKLLSTANTYLPSSMDFTTVGDFAITCKVSAGTCNTSRELTVKRLALPPQTFVNCGDNVLDCNGNSYPTLQIGSQCWITKNLNVGTYEAISGNIWDFDKEGIQKWCNGNNEANCTTYGGLYEWWEVVCNGKCNDKLTQANAMSWGLTSESQLLPFGVRMVSGSTTQVQGICPDGWHLPSRAEWNILINRFGGVNIAGTALKSNTLWDGTNTSGWNGEPGNHKSTSGRFEPVGSSGFWWTSEPSSNGNLAWFYVISSGQTNIAANYSVTGIGVGMSVRCLKN